MLADLLDVGVATFCHKSVFMPLHFFVFTTRCYMHSTVMPQTATSPRTPPCSRPSVWNFGPSCLMSDPIKKNS